MKKKLLFGGLLVMILAVATYMVANSISTLNEQSAGAKNTLVLSSLLTTLEYNVRKDPVKEYLKPTLLIYLNSECDYCQNQMQQINASPEILNHFQIILVSYEDFDVVAGYVNNYPLIASGNYIQYQVSPENVLKTFGKTSVPQLYVYEENVLKKSFKGITQSASLLKTIGL